MISIYKVKTQTFSVCVFFNIKHNEKNEEASLLLFRKASFTAAVGGGFEPPRGR